MNLPMKGNRFVVVLFFGFFLSHNNLISISSSLLKLSEHLECFLMSLLLYPQVPLGELIAPTYFSSIHFTKVDTVAYKSYRTTSTGKTAKFPSQVLAVLYSHTWYTFFSHLGSMGEFYRCSHFQWSKTAPLLPSSQYLFFICYNLLLSVLTIH